MTDSALRVLELGNSNRGFADRRETFTGDGDLGEADVVVMHFAELGNLFAQLVGQDREAAWPRVQAGMRRLEKFLEDGGTLIAVPVATSSAYYGSQPYVKELIAWAQRLIGAEPKHKTGQQVRPGDDPAYRTFFEKLGADLYHTMYLEKPEGPVGMTVADGTECVASHRWVGDRGLVVALPEVKNPEKRRAYVAGAVELASALRAAAGKPQAAARPAQTAEATAERPVPEAAPREAARAGSAIGPLERLLSSVRAASRAAHDNDDEAPAAAEQPAAAAGPAPANDDRRPPLSTVERSAATGAAPRPRPEPGSVTPLASASQSRKAAAGWSERFLLPEDAEIAQQIMAIEEKIAALHEEEKRLRQTLVSGKHRKTLFDGQGESFAGAAREAFEELGYRIEKAGNGDMSFVAAHASDPQAPAVVYCYASAGAAAEREIVARMLHLEALYYAKNGRLPKAIAVVNAHAATPLDERDGAPAALFGQELVDLAGRRGWCVLSGLQLMALAIEGEKSAEQREKLAQQLAQTQGVLSGYGNWSDYLVKTGV